MFDGTRAAEARSLHRRPATLLAAGVAMLATVLAGVGPATGQTGTAGSTSAPAVETLRAEADALANRYFSALARSEELDAEIDRNAQIVDELEAKAAKARADARARAQVAYRTSGSELGAVFDGDDVLDAARRARLIDHVNERDQATFTRLRAISQALREQHQALESTRKSQADAVTELREQGAAMDAKLAEAARRVEADRVAATAVEPTTGATAPPAATPAPGNAAAPRITTSPPPKTATPPPPPAYQGTTGTHPHHDDPFLVCVRKRESGGNYAAVNQSGPYLGAYQFLQSTWNGAANHGRRTELVGVPPNTASQYDQDDMAWTLYQWQGAGPWGGSCT